MKRGLKWVGIAVVSVALLVAATQPAERYFEIAKSLDIYATLFKEVNAYYVDEIDPSDLVRESIDGMLATLDPYTNYIPEDEVEDFRITTTGQYGGIGALIGLVNDKIVITYPYEGFPAESAGLKVGDEIIAVDDVDVAGKSTTDVSTLLKGQPRTMVVVTIHRPGSKTNQVLTLRRDKINVSNITYSGMIAQGVGYILLEDFTPGAGKEVEEAVGRLKQQGAGSIILDLRGNPGGMLYEAVNIVNVFIPKGKEVVSTRGKVDDWNKSYTTLNNPVDTQMPLTILVDGNSASAAEIVAGALQDYDRAVLVGERTFGKGLVQTTRPLAYNAQLKVTTAKYYIPSGRCIQELDYSHRNSDGSVDKVADSLRSEFKTQNGRSVYDGGGLEPDIHVESRFVGTITHKLIESGLLFDFATKYCAEHEPPSGFGSFRITDADYEGFVSWLHARDFSYTTPVEKKVLELEEVAHEGNSYKELEESLKTLQGRILSSKSTDLYRFRDEIRYLLKEQIAFHYGLNKGRVECCVKDDPDLIQALKVLGDATRFNQILARSN